MTRKPRGPKPSPITVTEQQRNLLEQITGAGKSPQALATRARIVLQAADGARTQHIADDLAIHWRTANRWRTRWEEASERLAAVEAEADEKTLRRLIIEEILADAPRPGSPPTFTAEQVCQIIAVACEDPEESERPVTHWTPQELRDEVIKRGIVESISVRSVGRFLKSGGVTTPSVSLLAKQQAG